MNSCEEEIVTTLRLAMERFLRELLLHRGMTGKRPWRCNTRDAKEELLSGITSFTVNEIIRRDKRRMDSWFKRDLPSVREVSHGQMLIIFVGPWTAFSDGNVTRGEVWWRDLMAGEPLLIQESKRYKLWEVPSKDPLELAYLGTSDNEKRIS